MRSSCAPISRACPFTGNFELFRTLAGFGGELVDLHARGKGEPHGPSASHEGRQRDSGDSLSPPTRPKSRVAFGSTTVNTSPHTGDAWTLRWLSARATLAERPHRSHSRRYEEQAEYQRIIWALMETGRLMGEIEREHSGARRLADEVNMNLDQKIIPTQKTGDGRLHPATNWIHESKSHKDTRESTRRFIAGSWHADGTSPVRDDRTRSVVYFWPLMTILLT